MATKKKATAPKKDAAAKKTGQGNGSTKKKTIPPATPPPPPAIPNAGADGKLNDGTSGLVDSQGPLNITISNDNTTGQNNNNEEKKNDNPEKPKGKKEKPVSTDPLFADRSVKKSNLSVWVRVDESYVGSMKPGKAYEVSKESADLLLQKQGVSLAEPPKKK